MILTLNTGNEKIQMGGYHKGSLLFHTAFAADLTRTAEEYAVKIKQLLTLYGTEGEKPEGAILASVAPGLTARLREALRLVASGKVLTVGPGLKTGLDIKVDHPGELGADLVCASVGAIKRYKKPMVIVSMDLAVSFIAVDRSGAFLGGCILPGPLLAMNALSGRAAQLPQVDLSRPPKSVVGTNTIACMQAGCYYGTASLLDGLMEKYRAELGTDTSFIVTGDSFLESLSLCKQEVTVHPTLVLDGLSDIYDRNIK